MPVEGQDEMIVSSFDLDFDVTLVEEAADANIWMDPFMKGVDEHLVPSLAGCPETARRLWMRGNRNLANIRHVVANAEASGKYQEGTPCDDGAAEPCYRAVVHLELFLIGDASSFDSRTLVINVITT